LPSPTLSVSRLPAPLPFSLLAHADRQWFHASLFLLALPIKVSSLSCSPSCFISPGSLHGTIEEMDRTLDSFVWGFPNNSIPGVMNSFGQSGSEFPRSIIQAAALLSYTFDRTLLPHPLILFPVFYGVRSISFFGIKNLAERSKTFPRIFSVRSC